MGRLSKVEAEAHGSAPAAAADDTPSDSPPAPGQAPAPVAAQPTGARSAAVTLPTIGTPAHEVFVKLYPHAAHGSGAAACRVALEIGRCTLASQILDLTLRTRDQQQGAMRAETDKRMLAVHEATRDSCAGITPEMEQLYFSHQRRAFRFGDLEVKAWVLERPGGYISHTPIDPVELEGMQNVFIKKVLRARRAVHLQQVMGFIYPMPDMPGFAKARPGNPPMLLALSEVAHRHSVQGFGLPRKAYQDMLAELTPFELKKLERYRREFAGEWNTEGWERSIPPPPNQKPPTADESLDGLVGLSREHCSTLAAK